MSSSSEQNTECIGTVSPIVLVYLYGIIRIGKKFTWNDLADYLRESSGRPLTETYINRYVEWGTKLRIFEEQGDVLVRLADGERLAEMPAGTPEYKLYMHQLLLRDSVYERFIALLKEFPRFDSYEIIERAGGWTGRAGPDNHTSPKTLRRWARELGVIVELKPTRRYIVVDQTLRFDEQDFWGKLLQTYDQMLGGKAGSGVGVRVALLRDEFCFRWRMHPDYFDQLLRELIRSARYGVRIQLSGAPARYLRELEAKGHMPLTIGKRQYMYVEISR